MTFLVSLLIEVLQPLEVLKDGLLLPSFLHVNEAQLRIIIVALGRVFNLTLQFVQVLQNKLLTPIELIRCLHTLVVLLINVCQELFIFWRHELIQCIRPVLSIDLVQFAEFIHPYFFL